MNGFPHEELRTLLRLYDEPIENLSSDDNWWRLGIVDVSKNFPTYRVGFGTSIVPQTHFFLQPFHFENLDGVAVVLATGGKMPFQFAGWVPSRREAEAKGWVATLNEAIKTVLASSSPSPRVSETNALRFEAGLHPNEFGMEKIEIDREGRLDYEQKIGTVTKRVTGTVEPARFQELLESLVLTSFPAKPQTTFVPGASMVRITTLPLNQSVLVDYFEAMRMKGYKEIVTALNKVATALRESRVGALSEWGFVQT